MGDRTVTRWLVRRHALPLVILLTSALGSTPLLGCAARYSVRSERLAGRDLTAPIELRLHDETITATVVSVETRRGVLSPGAVATARPEVGTRWLVETTGKHIAGVGLGSLLGLLLGIASGLVLATVECQAGGDSCVLLIPASALVGTFAGLGLGAAISNMPVEAEPVWP